MMLDLILKGLGLLLNTSFVHTCLLYAPSTLPNIQWQSENRSIKWFISYNPFKIYGQLKYNYNSL